MRAPVRHLSLALLASGIVAVGACGGGAPPAAEGGASTTTTAGGAGGSGGAGGAAPGCSTARPDLCLYRPAATYEVGTTTVEGLTYTDLTGAARNVNIAVYRPKDAPQPMPVIVLSHGGADGKTNPLKSMDAWAPLFAKAGYVAIAIAHEGRDGASQDALCAAVGVQAGIQCGLKINWDRPHDVDRVLAWLTEQAQKPELQGALDLSRMAHVGHSAGAGAAMMSGGVKRNFVCAQPFGVVDPQQACSEADLVSFAKPAIDVVVALSPQGPGSDGFMEASYGFADRPMLMATGAADGDPGEPENRLALFPLLAPGDKHKLYLDDPGAQHTLFEGTTEACEKAATPARCAQMIELVSSTGLAFIDAHLRNDAKAKAWLASDALVTAGGGLATLEHR